MTGRKLSYALLVALLLVIGVSQCGGTNRTHSLPRTDGEGDPYATDAEFAPVTVGMSDSEAFQLLAAKDRSAITPTGATPTPAPARPK